MQNSHKIQMVLNEEKQNENGKRISTTAREETTSKTMKNSSFQTSIIQNMRKNSTTGIVLNSKHEENDKFQAALAESVEVMFTDTPVLPKSDFYGLPKLVKDLLQKHQGITELYQWQDECLRSPSICNHKNMILCLPTSGGKTLIAQILILKELLCENKNALLILPFVSIVQEKVREMSPMAIELDFIVEDYSGNKGSFPPRKKRNRRTVYIATIEKAHSLVNSLIETGRLKEIGLLVVDELHMIGDGEHRGATLENTLTKIKFMEIGIQIIGLSATLGRTSDIKKFMNADVFEGHFRPIELKEYVKIGDNILEVDPRPIRTEEKFLFVKKCIFPALTKTKIMDPDQIAGLVLEVCPQNSCLVFCPTKKNTENVAKLIVQGMTESLKSHKSEEKKALLTLLLSEGNGSICQILKFTIPYGVAYHHSGLTMDERHMLEESYAKGTLCCLTCTSTLAAGVNLPAKRVILRSPYIGNEFLTINKYKQMIGRAGRTGIDTSGESILIIQANDRNKIVLDLFNAVHEKRLTSSLFNNEKGLKSLILSLIGLQIVKNVSDIDRFLAMTLLAVQKESFKVDMFELRTNAIMGLIEVKLIKAIYKDNENQIEHATLSVTDLGRAAFKGNIDVDIVDKLHNDLTIGLGGLVLHNHLHLLFLVTPYEVLKNIYFRQDIFQDKYMKLNSEDSIAAINIGIPISHVSYLASGRTLSNMQVIHRFYITLILYELWRGKDVWDVAFEFELHRGTIQQLLISAIRFASCVFYFCQELSHFWAYAALLETFVKQFSYCVNSELIPLMELPGVKKTRANLMYKSGYKSLQDVANAKVGDLVRDISYLPRRIATEMIAAAQMLIIEKANDLRDQAEDLVECLHT